MNENKFKQSWHDQQKSDAKMITFLLFNVHLFIFLTRQLPLGVTGLLEPVPATAGWKQSIEPHRNAQQILIKSTQKMLLVYYVFLLCFKVLRGFACQKVKEASAWRAFGQNWAPGGQSTLNLNCVLYQASNWHIFHGFPSFYCFLTLEVPRGY